MSDAAVHTADHEHDDAHASGGFSGGGGDDHPHVVSPLVLIATFAGLIFLTFVTVAVTYLPSFGMAIDISIALAVAAVKATLVALFFMHLWWDSPFNGIVLAAALFFVVIFIVIALIDSKEYKPNLVSPNLPAATANADDGGH